MTILLTILELFSHGGAYIPNLSLLLWLEPLKSLWWGGWVCKPILVFTFGPRFGLKTEAGPSWTKTQLFNLIWLCKENYGSRICSTPSWGHSPFRAKCLSSLDSTLIILLPPHHHHCLWGQNWSQTYICSLYSQADVVYNSKHVLQCCCIININSKYANIRKGTKAFTSRIISLWGGGGCV